MPIRLNRTPTRNTPLTRADVDCIVERYRTDGSPKAIDIAALTVLIYTWGLRVSDAIDLTRADAIEIVNDPVIDYPIIERKTAARLNNINAKRAKAGKKPIKRESCARHLQPTKDLVEWLRHQLGNTPKSCKYLFPPRNKTGEVLPRDRCKHITRQTAARRLKPVIKDLQRENRLRRSVSYGLHSIRKASVQAKLNELGGDMKALRRWLGHRSISPIENYFNQNDECLGVSLTING